MNRLNGQLTQTGLSSPLFNHRDHPGNRTVFGFISSATASMIADHPKTADVEKDVSRLRITDFQEKKAISIPQFILKHKLNESREHLLELIRLSGFQTKNFRQQISSLKISHLYKTGALLKNGQVEQFRKMSINDTHIQQFDRDFLGFILFIAFEGRLIFNADTPDPFFLKFSFSRIPLLSFKSENAFKDEKSREICRQMLISFSSKEILPVFI